MNETGTKSTVVVRSNQSTRVCVCVWGFEYVVKGTGKQNSCSVSSSLLLQNVLDRAGVSPSAHHALLSVVFVCMTLLCSAVISVKTFDKSASSSLPFSSEKIILQWKKKKGRMC